MTKPVGGKIVLKEKEKITPTQISEIGIDSESLRGMPGGGSAQSK